MLIKILVATFVGGLAFFVAGFVVYGLILDPLMIRPNFEDHNGMMRDHPMWVPLVLSNFANALVLAFIFEKIGSVRTFASGFSAGAVIFMIVAFANQMSLITFLDLVKNHQPIIADIFGSAITGGIAGGVIGQTLAMMHKKR